MKAILGPFLGHVGPDSATVWVRARAASPEGAGPLHVTATPSRGGPSALALLRLRPDRGGTAAGRVALPGGPGARHDVAIRSETGVLVGDLEVTAAPAPSRDGAIAFAFGSCWRPDAGPDSAAAWRVLDALAQARWIDHLLLLGDQVYADQTRLESSQLELEAGRTTAVERVLALPPSVPVHRRAEPYRDLYQQSWRDEAVQAVMARLPTTMTWDDHDIVNGWGSVGWHEDPRGRKVFEAASRAFDEFQGSRNPPPLLPGSRAHAFRRGPAAFLTLDLRTARRSHARELLGAAQRAAVEAHLAGSAREASVLFLSCSVPLLHLPVALQSFDRYSDVVDQWSSRENEDERRWLLGLLRDYEEGGVRRAILLGGDSHLATAATLTDTAGRRTWQVTSSPLAHRAPPYLSWALSLLGSDFPVRAGAETLRGKIHRRWAGPNVGVVRGEVRGGRSALTFELFRPRRRTEIVSLD